MHRAGNWIIRHDYTLLWFSEWNLHLAGVLKCLLLHLCFLSCTPSKPEQTQILLILLLLALSLTMPAHKNTLAICKVLEIDLVSYKGFNVGIRGGFSEVGK